MWTIYCLQTTKSKKNVEKTVYFNLNLCTKVWIHKKELYSVQHIQTHVHALSSDRPIKINHNMNSKKRKKRENIADTMIKDNLLFCPNPQTHANFNVHKGPHTFVSVIPKIQWTKTANCYLTGTQTKKRVVKKFTAIHEKKNTRDW